MLIVGITLFLLRFLTGEVLFGLLGLTAFCGYAALNASLVIAFGRNHRWLVASAGAMLLVALVNGAEYQGRTIYYLAVGCSVAFACHAMTEKTELALVIARGLLFGFVAIVVAYMPFKGINPDDFNHYFPNSSRNGISAFLLFFQIFYSAAYYLKHRRAPLVTPMMTLLLCIPLYGRSGTLIAAAIVVVSCIAVARTQRWQAIAAAFGTAAIMAIVLFPDIVHLPELPEALPEAVVTAPVDPTAPPAPVAPQVVPPAPAQTVQQAPPQVITTPAPDPGISEWRRGLRTVRTTMAAEYISILTPMDLLLGASLSSAPSIAAHGLNPHNSFIRGHAYFGVPYLLMMIGMFVSAAMAAWRTGHWFLFALMVVFAARAYLDAFALFDLFDFGFFFSYFSLTNSVIFNRR